MSYNYRTVLINHIYSKKERIFLSCPRNTVDCLMLSPVRPKSNWGYLKLKAQCPEVFVFSFASLRMLTTIEPSNLNAISCLSEQKI
jgi:hypothetical protein